MSTNYILSADGELYHYGVKGQKWGVRRYQNKDGTLTPDGLKRYRKDYDDIRSLQRAKTNKTGISAVDKYNSNYYDKKARSNIALLTKRIGKRGLTQLDEEVIREGKTAAKKAMQEAERINKWIKESFINEGIEPEENALFLRNPKEDYDYVYNRYLEDNLVRR